MADETEYQNSRDYLEATGALTGPWDPEQYVVPREVGTSPTDVTSFMPGQQWSLEDLPNILYFIEPPPGWKAYKSKRVDIKRDASGNPILERWPRPGKQPQPLRNFPALPDQIGTMEHPLYLLAWRRLEPAANWGDFLVRMENVPSRPAKGNVLSMRISRLSDPFSIVYTWHGTKDWVRPTKDQERRLGKLSAEAQAANSTRGFTPGLISPARGEQGGRIPVPEAGRSQGRGHKWQKRSLNKKNIARPAAAAANRNEDDLERLPTPSSGHSSTYESESYESLELENASNTSYQPPVLAQEGHSVFQSSDDQSSNASDMSYPNPDFRSSTSSYVLDKQQLSAPRFYSRESRTQHHEQYPNHEVADHVHRSYNFPDMNSQKQNAWSNSGSQPLGHHHHQHEAPRAHVRSHTSERHPHSHNALYQPYPTFGHVRREHSYRPNTKFQMFEDRQPTAHENDFQAETQGQDSRAQGVCSPFLPPFQTGFRPQQHGTFPNIPAFDNRAFVAPNANLGELYYHPNPNILPAQAGEFTVPVSDFQGLLHHPSPILPPFEDWWFAAPETQHSQDQFWNN